MERRLTTILAADMVGYSRLMAADEEGVIARLRTLRAELIDPAIAANEGRIVKTMGDGLLVEFGSPVAAVHMAIAVQDAMQAREQGAEDQRIRFRMGINTGDIVIDGDDILGDAVNIAARLESLAPPGGVCIGRPTHDQISGRVEAPLTALGPQMVKNIPTPVDVWRVEIDGVTAPVIAKKAERPSIAVLPFDNMSADPDQEFLADGIVEDVITELSRFRSLLVIARNSTFAYKGTHKDIREIAKELDVRYVVEGSVRRAGNRLRVTAQLIEAETGAHLWAERWDRTMADLFDLQDEITAAIVAPIAPEIGAHERALVRRRPTESLTAWELCQRAWVEFHRYDSQAFIAAEELARRAAAADPNMALPCALIARIKLTAYMSGGAPDPNAARREALDWAKRAMALDPRDEEVLFAIAFAESMNGRSAVARDHLTRGVSLNPNHAALRSQLAFLLLTPDARDPTAALEHAKTALRLSPGDPFAWSFRSATAFARVHLGDLEAGAGLADSLGGFSSLDWKPFATSAVCALELGHEAQAANLVARSLEKFDGLTIAHLRETMGQVLPDGLIDDHTDKLVALGLPEN